jgi:hypothetical protein
MSLITFPMISFSPAFGILPKSRADGLGRHSGLKPSALICSDLLASEPVPVTPTPASIGAKVDEHAKPQPEPLEAVDASRIEDQKGYGRPRQEKPAE